MSRSKHKITIGQREIPLTSDEFKLFKYLQQQPEILVTREQVIKDVFQSEAMVFDRAVDTHVKILKRKLGKDNDCIEIVKGIGYKYHQC